MNDKREFNPRQVLARELAAFATVAVLPLVHFGSTVEADAAVLTSTAIASAFVLALRMPLIFTHILRDPYPPNATLIFGVVLFLSALVMPSGREGESWQAIVSAAGEYHILLWLISRSMIGRGEIIHSRL